jgi:tRNA(Ile)-lysidine synthase
MQPRPRLTPAIADARRAIREHFAGAELQSTKSVLLAVSGGPDSMALALAAGFELPKLGVNFSAGIVNHNLQPESGEVAQATAERLRALGVASKILDIRVPRGKAGPEALARKARYEALESHRQELGADYIVLGHNLDDQAESVLLGLTRGSGLKSIAGMRFLDGLLVRPFLGIEKAVLTKACDDAGVQYWIDPHNQDSAFTRVRIRKLMQTIEAELGPGVNLALARTASLATEADDYLSIQARELIATARLEAGYAVSVLSSAHAAVLHKALQLLCLDSGAQSVSHSQVMSVAELISNWHGQKPLSLSGITVERVRDQILFRQSS